MEYERELERKFVVAGGVSFDRAEYLLTIMFNRPRLSGSHVDKYWVTGGADFVRLRGNSRELTVKVTDLGTTTNRVEENVVVEEASMLSAERLLTIVLGPSVGALTKKYAVFSKDGVEVSLYSVEGDPEGRLFLEVEAEHMDDVDRVSESLGSHLYLHPENRSLFQCFFPDFNRGAL